MTWSVTIEKGRGSERTGVRSVRTLVVVSPESLETAGGVQKTQVPTVQGVFGQGRGRFGEGA